jgi:hypothetical protein
MGKGIMIKKRFTLAGMALLAALLAVVLTTASALAHEKRHVGDYTFVVGFLDEPAYANVKNSLDLTICNGSDCNYTVQDAAKVLSNPINDADKTLKIEVSTGGSAPLALTLEPRWANPGKYNAYFLPTKTGDYTFHIFGTLNNNSIDEKFTSSPTGFSAVEQVQTYPSTSADASNADVTALKSQVQNVQNSATTATTVGIVGAVLGVLGLIVAGFALARKPKFAGVSSPETKTPSESLRG